MSRRVTRTAFARAGLLGNPSDAYGGKAIACSVFEFGARVHIESGEPGAGFEIAAAPRHRRLPSTSGDTLRAADARAGLAALREGGCRGSAALLQAALLRFAAHCALDAQTDPFSASSASPANDARLRLRMHFESDVPFQAGLAGSSAIVIAALRALAAWFEVDLAPFDVSELALAAEVEELGIAAGPMDRAIQAYEGVLAMDFGGPRSPDRYRALDPASLPPLFLAWDPQGGEASGDVHSEVRARWQRGDADVRKAMRVFPQLVDAGLECLARGDARGFLELANRNFEARAALFPIAERDRTLVEIGRRAGAGVKLCGSGGAVVGVLEDPRIHAKLADAYREAGFDSLRLAPRRAATPNAASTAPTRARAGR